MRLRGFPIRGRETALPDLPADRPLKLEIGFGKGASLLAAARADPGSHYLGIEAAHSYLALVEERRRLQDLGNVTLVGGDGEALLRALPEASFARISILFPDPWPKRRHMKRRILNPVVVHLVATRLTPRGAFVFKTDVEDYFVRAEKLLDAEPRLVRALATSKPRHLDSMTALTGFERKFRIAGRRIYGSVHVRVDRPRGALP